MAEVEHRRRPSAPAVMAAPRPPVVEPDRVAPQCRRPSLGQSEGKLGADTIVWPPATLTG